MDKSNTIIKAVDKINTFLDAAFPLCIVDLDVLPTTMDKSNTNSRQKQYCLWTKIILWLYFFVQKGEIVWRIGTFLDKKRFKCYN